MQRKEEERKKKRREEEKEGKGQREDQAVDNIKKVPRY